MHIEETIKLDFKDVLIRPKRSTLKSRSEVDLMRQYKFLHTGYVWRGVPIIAANMDHTGTFEMADVLSKHSMVTALSKFMTEEAWLEFAGAKASALSQVFVSAGLRDDDFELLKRIMKEVACPFICLDVANGSSEFFADFIKRRVILFLIR